MLIAYALFTAIITTKVFSPTVTASSIKLLSGAVSVKDIYFTDDFIITVVIERGTQNF